MDFILSRGSEGRGLLGVGRVNYYGFFLEGSEPAETILIILSLLYGMLSKDTMKLQRKVYGVVSFFPNMSLFG